MYRDLGFIRVEGRHARRAADGRRTRAPFAYLVYPHKPFVAFVPETVDEALERRSECAREPVSDYMNTEHVEAEPHCSDAQLAETFLHHRVLIVPIVESREVRGVVTRWDFFTALAGRLRP